MTSIALLIGIGIIAAVITLLFVFMFETIINNGEGEGGPKLSNPDKQFMKVESVTRLSAITFGTDFGRITDIETGPD